jgi:hypothetical protein
VTTLLNSGFINFAKYLVRLRGCLLLCGLPRDIIMMSFRRAHLSVADAPRQHRLHEGGDEQPDHRR